MNVLVCTLVYILVHAVRGPSRVVRVGPFTAAKVIFWISKNPQISVCRRNAHAAITTETVKITTVPTVVPLTTRNIINKPTFLHLVTLTPKRIRNVDVAIKFCSAIIFQKLKPTRTALSRYANPAQMNTSASGGATSSHRADHVTHQKVSRLSTAAAE